MSIDIDTTLLSSSSTTVEAMAVTDNQGQSAVKHLWNVASVYFKRMLILYQGSFSFIVNSL